MLKLRKKYITLSKQQRLLQSSLPIIAVTGGIASGKSTVTKKLQEYGLQITCADSIIKDIYKTPEIIALLHNICPIVVTDQQINFTLLRKVFFQNEPIKKNIEERLFKLYPIYLEKSFKQVDNQNFILYDVPLLFEKELHTQVDSSICVYTSSDVQLQRVQQRDGSSIELALKILENQLPIDSKKELADYVLYNIEDLPSLYQEIQSFFNKYFING